MLRHFYSYLYDVPKKPSSHSKVQHPLKSRPSSFHASMVSIKRFVIGSNQADSCDVFLKISRKILWHCWCLHYCYLSFLAFLRPTFIMGYFIKSLIIRQSAVATDIRCYCCAQHHVGWKCAPPKGKQIIEKWCLFLQK